MFTLGTLREVLSQIGKFLDFNEQCRQMDMRALWPECCRQASDLDHAKAAFATHALRDQAWLVLGRDKVIAFINELDWPKFTCPKCKMTSHHPQDWKNSYCGNCHEFFI